MTGGADETRDESGRVTARRLWRVGFVEPGKLPEGAELLEEGEFAIRAAEARSWYEKMAVLLATYGPTEVRTLLAKIPVE